jgi:Dockerin type I domain
MTSPFVFRRFIRHQAFLLLALGFTVHGQSVLKNPRWKVQVLIYDHIDFQFTDSSGHPHWVTTSMTQQEKDLAVSAATKFLGTDVPALDSGNMIPLASITVVPHPLTRLAQVCGGDYGYWPDPTVTAADRNPAVFDSAIVIFQEHAFDSITGQWVYLGCSGGLTWPMGTSQAYASFIFRIFSSDQRNVFKHEWGHSILFYYDAAGAAPKPAVDNHINDTTTRYVHCGTAAPYILVDDSDSYPIPNSIYNDQSGFTHDYYSGITATPDQPNRCLGITPAAWVSGGPVIRPIANPGDLNGDHKVDINDLGLLMQRLNQAAGPNDPRDLDYDGQITVLDARILVTLCTNPHCAP